MWVISNPPFFGSIATFARVNVLRRESRLSEQVRERHREAARVGRAEKLLRVRSRHTSKPSPKRISGIDLA